MTTVLEKQSPPDIAQREQAITSLEKNVIVMAGAGTGKTTLLIDRLVLLILGKGIPVERIVALTFTKKAAEEIRERLESKLREILETPDSHFYLNEFYPDNKEQWPKMISQALDDIPKAQIGTIHSFAGSLLRLYPMQANIDPKFREDEGELFEAIFENEWRLWLAEELGNKAPRADLWKPLLELVSIDDLKIFSQQCASPLVDVEALTKPVDLKEFIVSKLNQLSHLRSNYPSSDKAKVFMAGLEATEKVFQSVLDGKVLDEEDIEGVRRFSADKPPKAWVEARDQLKDLKRIANAICELDDQIVQTALEAIVPFINRVQSELRRRGVVSFEGLLVFARNLLRDNKDVRADVKRRYHTFLIDEFQDTDPLQGEILFYMAEKDSSSADHWEKVQLQEGRLFVVGDPKQSIYRFRGADIAAFESFQEHMVQQGAAQAELSSNFRSHDHLLGSVNESFPYLMRKEPLVQPAYAPLVPGKQQEPREGLKMVLVQENPVEKTKASVVRKREAAFIAQWIRGHIGKEINGKALQYRDCALLFRSANVFEDYLEALKSNGIPYLAEGEKFFYQTVEVTQFLSLVSAIADPNDKLALVGVLRSPLGGLTDNEIFKLKQSDQLDYRKKPSILKPKIGPLYQTLHDLFIRSQFEPIGKLIRTIFEKTWVLELTSQARFGEQAIANLLKIESLANKWSESNPMTLKAFVKRFRQFRQDEKEESENPLADVKYDAVKLMTVHKAKGLEFPVVFLPNLCAARGGMKEKPVVVRDWKSGLFGLRLPLAKKTNAAMLILEEEIRKREKAEEVRVFYVAATRAKERMMMMLREKPSSSSQTTNFIVKGGLWPVVSKPQIKLGSYQVPAHTILWEKEKEEATFIQPKERLGSAWEESKLSQMISQREKEAEQLKNQPLISSPSLEMRKQKELAEIEQEKWRVVEEESYQPSSKAIQLGLLCHKVLEEWDFSTTEKDLGKVFSKLLQRSANLFELSQKDPQSSEILKEAKSILSKFFKSQAYETIKKSKIVGREVPFLYSSKDNQLMRGVIDLIYEIDGKLVIADYKTNKINPSTLSDVANSYKVQGDIYRKALQKTLNREATFELLFLRNGKSIEL